MDVILARKDIPHLEIEFRLGRKTRNGTFDTNVGKPIFDKVYRRLSRYPSWDSVKRTKSEIYYGEKKGHRILYDQETEEQTCIMKTTIENVDEVLQGKPLDVRISSSVETPSTYDQQKDKFPFQIMRDRTSFIRKGLSIDLSVIHGSTELDSEDALQYRIELEIIDPSSLTPATYINHYAKIDDVLKLCV
jgi:hypothetical protein